MATIGMMDSAFFVGRQEILTWLNTFLQLNYQKIEDTANGAASCQLLDALHPGSVALNRVDYNAQREFECLQNYQVLQDAFAKVGIEKTIPVNDLCRGKYRDNLEWMQWMKRYFGLHWSDEAKYEAKARRKEAKCVYPGDNPAPTSLPQQHSQARPASNVLGARMTAARVPQSQSMAGALATPQRPHGHSAMGSRPMAQTQPRAPRPSLPANTRPMVQQQTHTPLNSNSPITSPPSQPPASKSAPSINTATIMRDSTNAGAAAAPQNTTPPPSTATSPTAIDATPAPQRAVSQLMNAQLAEARTQNAQLRALLDTVEKERDFYFAKLRQIEIWCDQRQNLPTHSSEDIASKRFLTSIQAILYKPDA